MILTSHKLDFRSIDLLIGFWYIIQNHSAFFFEICIGNPLNIFPGNRLIFGKLLIDHIGIFVQGIVVCQGTGPAGNACVAVDQVAFFLIE